MNSVIDQSTTLVAPSRISTALRAVGTFMRRKVLGAVGAIIILIFVVVALFADQLAPFDPYTINAKLILQAPGSAHWISANSGTCCANTRNHSAP